MSSRDFAVDERAHNEHVFLSSICFSGKCSFTLNNEPAIQNTRHLALENPKISILTRTPKNSILAEIFNNNPFE